MKNIKSFIVIFCVSLLVLSCTKDNESIKKDEKENPDKGDETTVPKDGLFKLVYPEDKAEDLTVDIKLQWIHEEGFVYDVFLGESNDKLINVTIDKYKNYFYPQNLMPESKYYWKVVATNSTTNVKKESPLYSFVTFSSVAEQPKAVRPSEDLDNIIGFWDFTKDGRNSVLNHSADWNIMQQSMISPGYLVIDKSYNSDGMNLYDLSVNLWNHKTSGFDKGLASRRYFSGAMRFKINEYQDSNSFLTFGVTSRWLTISIEDNNKLVVNVDYGKIAKETDISVARDQWHVLYFRYEVFEDSGDYKNDGKNRFYLQLDNNKEILINFGEYELDKIAKEEDIFLSFVDTANATHMIGEVDWCIMARGRMIPSTVQYRVQGLK